MSEDRSQPPATAKWISADRLRAIISTYGAAAERWPADERDAALALIARSETARATRDAAAGLDATLDSLQPPMPSDLLDARVRRLSPPRDPAASIPRPFFALGKLLPLRGWVPVAVGALGVVLVGAALMLAVPAPDEPARLPVAAVEDPSDSAEESPDLLAGVAIVDPLPPEAVEMSDDFTDSDLGTDSSLGFTGDGGALLTLGELALE